MTDRLQPLCELVCSSERTIDKHGIGDHLISNPAVPLIDVTFLDIEFVELSGSGGVSIILPFCPSLI